MQPLLENCTAERSRWKENVLQLPRRFGRGCYILPSGLKHPDKSVGKAVAPGMDSLKRKLVASVLTGFVIALASLASGQQMFRTPSPDASSAPREEGRGEPSVSVPTSEEQPPEPETPPETPKPTTGPKKGK